MAKRKNVTVDEQYLGPEPTWDDQDKLTDTEFRHKYMSALNWYNYYFDKSKARKIVQEYVKTLPDNTMWLDACKKVPDWAFGSTLTSCCQMRLNGCTRRPMGEKKSDVDFVTNKLNELLEMSKNIQEENKEQEKEKPQKPVISLQERVRQAAAAQTEGIEDAIEAFSENGYKSDFNTYKYCQKNQIKGQIAKRMIDFYIDEANELEEALLGQDEQLVEGYSHMAKKDLKAFAKFMRGICDDLQRWSDNQKAFRKPRKKKPVPIEKQVAKVKYQKEFPEMKLVSIPPEKVIGAMVVWVYNTKYRKIGKYVAGTRDGFSFKGTTLQRFDEQASIQKKLRKPEEVVDRCLNGGKIVLRKLMEEVKTKEQPMNGRFNEDTIILRIADL